jgi:broad specificity phosphatase PhoE
MLFSEKKLMRIPPYPFYIVRHGETDWNQQGMIMGHQDIPLNERGIDQANILKNVMQQLTIETIWTSPLLRARQTAEIINEGSNHRILQNRDLMERGWGVGEGTIHLGQSPDVIKDFELGNMEESLPEGAESYINFKNRISSAFHEILEPSTLPPLIVSHGGVLFVLAMALAQTTIIAKNCELYYFKPPNQENNSWIVQQLE